MLNTIGTNGKKSAKRAAKGKVDVEKYRQLLYQHHPTLIETEKENRRALAIVDELMVKGKDRTPEETALLKLLAHLIQDFETRFYPPPETSPREVLIELMNANGLRQIDLVPLFGSKSVISEVINGKRAISKAQAKLLAKRFNLSTDAFL
jgi:HTH-type transcriptional regulator/antitoxin HigA